jgi:hypothetical protein
MSSENQKLSAICEAATVIDLEYGHHLPYRELYVEPPVAGTIKIDSITHTYLVYWPGGLAAYIVATLASEHLQPSFIEAAHASAKLLKPFSPLKSRRR